MNRDLFRKAEIASGERDIHGGAEDYVDAFFLEMEKSDKGDSFTYGSRHTLSSRLQRTLPRYHAV